MLFLPLKDRRYDRLDLLRFCDQWQELIASCNLQFSEADRQPAVATVHAVIYQFDADAVGGHDGHKR